MNCTNCKERMDNNSVFCPNCGEKVVQQANTNFNNSGNTTATVQQKNKSNLSFIIPIAVIAIISLAVFMLFSGGGKPETVVNNFFKAIDKVNPDMMLDTLSGQLKNETLDEVSWDKSELAYEISDMKDEFRYEFGDGWLKQVKITSEYNDKDSAVVGILMFGEYNKVRLMKEGKKWVIMEFPW